MFEDRIHRLISYHDTWISLDPVLGCPYSCVYCVLRHSEHTGITNPQQKFSPRECVEHLLRYPFFAIGKTHIAIGNETDMLHPRNRKYLLELLKEMSIYKINNPIILITKAPLSDNILSRIRTIKGINPIFFLSYSGLGQSHEPNFTDRQFRRNFSLVKQNEFPLVHYWRPLLPKNSSIEAVKEMLSFVSQIADASVFIGLKIHPELTRVITKEGVISVPQELVKQTGEWLSPEVIHRIYNEAKDICPEYPLYRHTSCALAYVLRRPNHTGTIYRKDICLPSHCPGSQRQVCKEAFQIPNKKEIARILSVLNREISFERYSNKILIKGDVNQEEFAFLLHNLNCPIEVNKIKMQNLYHGDIYKGQTKKVNNK